MDVDLGKRLFDFAVNVIKYVRKFPNGKEYEVIKYQLVKSSTSSGANFEESQSASSKADFKHKIDITLREMRESNYWLRIVKAISISDSKMDALINESEELKKILGSICSKISRN